MIYHDELVSGELGQIGTQFDGLGHIGIGDLFYNGNNRLDFAKAEGLQKLGVENVGAIATRGVLVDVAGYKGVERLEGGYEITLADLQGALRKQGTEIHSGDVVLVHSGWGIALDGGQREVRRTARRASASRPRGISSSARS